MTDSEKLYNTAVSDYICIDDDNVYPISPTEFTEDTFKFAKSGKEWYTHNRSKAITYSSLYTSKPTKCLAITGSPDGDIIYVLHNYDK